MKHFIARIIRYTLSSIALLGAVNTWAQGTPASIEDLSMAKDLGVSTGQTVTPAYEGWYRQRDGSIAAVFGYYNRNAEEMLEIPVGENNRIEGAPGGNQPTRFLPGRHWGVFTVTLPEEAQGSDSAVVWRLQNRGKTFEIPANLETQYMVDAIVGDANGNFPPRIRFSIDEPFNMGPAGVTTGPIEAMVGEPLTITVQARDDGTGAMPSGSDEFEVQPLQLAWLKHQGPGEVSFSHEEARVPVDGGEAATQATFSEPGQYIVRLRVNDASGRVGGGHAQCCWTNGFVKVDVSE